MGSKEREARRAHEREGRGGKKRKASAASQVTEQLFMELLGEVFPLH